MCLDSTLSLFLMTSVVTLLFSVSQISNTLRYLPAEGKAKGPLRHLMVICIHPYSSSRRYVVSINVPVQVELGCSARMHHYTEVSSSSPDRVLSCDERRTQHSVLSCDNQQNGNKVAWLLQPRDEEPRSPHVFHVRSSSL